MKSTKTRSLVAVTTLAAGLLVAVPPAAQAAAPADVVITEVAYGGNAAYSGDSGDGEYVELTNVGGFAQDVAGWFYDSSSATVITTPSPTAGLSLATLADTSGTNTVVAPGESVVITDLAPADFRAEWGVKSSVKVINDGAFTLKKSGSVYLSNGTTVLDQISYNLSGPGKGVSAWLSSANLADQQTVAGSTFSFAAATGTSNGWTVSTADDSEGSWKSVGGSVGSPGASTMGTSTPADVRTTALTVTGGADQTATLSQAFSFTGLNASGGTAPYTWSAPALTGTGLSIDSASGAITGTPGSTGSINVTATATDSVGASASTSFTILVGSGVDPNWADIVINEVTSDNSDDPELTSKLPAALFASLNSAPNSAADLVELHNWSGQAVDITGWKQTDSHAGSTATDFSGRVFDVNGNRITSIPAHGYGVFQSGQGLGSGGDSVKIYLPDGTTLVDSVTFLAGQAGYDESLDPKGDGPTTTEIYHAIARCPDGAGPVNSTTSASPSPWYSVKTASFGSSNDSACDTSTDPAAAVQFYNQQPPTGLPSTCLPGAPTGSNGIAVPGAVAWPTSDGVTTVDNQCEFITGQDPTGNDLSSLVFSGDGSVLWGAQNKNHVWKLVKDPATGKFLPATDNSWGNGKAITFTGTDPTASQPDDEGLTVGGNGNLFVTSERDNTNSSVSKDEVLEYDPDASGATIAPVRQWDLTADFAPSVITATGDDANLGFEGVTYVPDSFLATNKFRDQNLNKTYNPADYPLHGSGLYFLGLEKNGHVYAYALNSDGTHQRVADIDTGIDGTSAIADLQFNSDDQGIWTACDNDCGVADSLLRINGQGNFVRVVTYDRPAGLPDDNLEGFAIAPASTAVDGKRQVVWSDDGIYGEGNALNADHTGNLPSPGWGHALYSSTIGSSVAPGLPDVTPPTITFAGNAGTYGALSTVAITATAADSGSGVASFGWTNVNAPAYSFGPGLHTLTATATDKAGNPVTATTTFTVTVTPAQLSTLTTQFVQGSAKYKSANLLTKVVASGLVGVITSLELRMSSKATPAAKATLLKAYRSQLQTFVSNGWLNASQAVTLVSFAGAL